MNEADSEIHQLVSRELESDLRLAGMRIDVDVVEGRVVLTGTVDHWTKRNLAQHAAYRVSGVVKVAMAIDVKVRANTEALDIQTVHAVRHIRERNEHSPQEGIRSAVAEGQSFVGG